MGMADVRPDFEWDPKKAQGNFRKHQVHFEEAATIFEDPQFVTVVDAEHSHDEERYITIGLSSKGRLLLTAHTETGHSIRIISARKATRHEEEFYQEAG
jgi:uncharacterized DUF497 family protein